MLFWLKGIMSQFGASSNDFFFPLFLKAAYSLDLVQQISLLGPWKMWVGGWVVQLIVWPTFVHACLLIFVHFTNKQGMNTSTHKP